MRLNNFTGFNEMVRFKFREGLQYFFIQLWVIATFFALLVYVFLEEDFFWIPIAGLGLVVFLLRIYKHYLTIYFVTDIKVYRKVGLLAPKVTGVKGREVDDIIVQQSFLDRFLFDKGEIRINTPGSDKFELKLKRVGNPFAKKKQIEQIWSVAKTIRQ